MGVAIATSILAPCDLGMAATSNVENPEVAAAKIVIDEYFSAADRRYELLSHAYKARLRRHAKIKNAAQYDDAVLPPERVWRRHRYEKATRRDNVIELTVLVDWEQEGYSGVQTFIFDLVQENRRWSIENIMH